MPPSLISNLERRTGRVIPAAPVEGVLSSSAALGWQGITAELHQLAPDHLPEHLVQTHRLMVHAGAPTRFEFREAGGAWQQRTLTPGTLFMLADGTPNEPRWRDTMQFMAIALSPELVAASFAEAARGPIRLTPVHGTADPVVADFAQRLQRELAEPSFAGALFGQTLALALSRHLLDRHGGGVLPPRGSLSGRQLARVMDYIDAHLAEELCLTAIAAQAHVSPFHFARLFRAATGLSPHQFVLRLRIDRAKRLIRSQGAQTLTAVAAAAGFFDQAHFTKTFRRLVGVTPSAYAAAS